MPFCKIIQRGDDARNITISIKILLALKTILLDATQNDEQLVKQIEECRVIIENSYIKGSEQILSLPQKREEIRRNHLIDLTKKAGPRFSDLAMSEEQTDLKNTVEHALPYPDRFNVTPLSAILLYGAPGTGKAMLAKTAAYVSGAAQVFSLSAYVINAKEENDAIEFIKMLFRMAKNAQPSAVIIIDEIDVLLGNGMEGRVKAEFLLQMNQDECRQRVLVLATTIKPWAMDENVMQRFSKHIHVKMPDQAGRMKVLQKIVDAKPTGFALTR